MSTGSDQCTGHPELAPATDLEQGSDSSVWPLTSSSLDHDSDLSNSSDSETEPDMRVHQETLSPENSELDMTQCTSSTSATVQRSDSGKHLPAGKSTKHQ